MRKEHLMKFNYRIILILFISGFLKADNTTTTLPTPNKEEKQTLTFMQQVQQEEKESLHRILSTFVLMLTNFFNIAKAPKDPSILGPNLTQMAGGLISIAMEMFRKISFEDDESTTLNLTMTEEDLVLVTEIKQLLIEYGAKLEAIALEQKQ